MDRLVGAHLEQGGDLGPQLVAEGGYQRGGGGDGGVLHLLVLVLPRQLRRDRGVDRRHKRLDSATAGPSA